MQKPTLKNFWYNLAEPDTGVIILSNFLTYDIINVPFWLNGHLMNLVGKVTM